MRTRVRGEHMPEDLGQSRRDWGSRPRPSQESHLKEKQGALGQRVKILSPTRADWIGLDLGFKAGEGHL